MKNLYKFVCRIVLIVVSIISVTSFQSAKAQTTLVKGDLAITGYVGNGVIAGNDKFSFVLLKAVTTGTVVNFTDNAWLRTSPTTGSWRTGEGTVTWTSNANYPAGREITIEITGGATATATYMTGTTPTSAGTATGTTMPSLSTNGDQIIAYQGATATPTFITAIHMNSYNASIVGEPITNTTDWEGAYSTANSCGLPALTSVSASNFLTNGVDAIWIPQNPTVEYDNAVFRCTGNLSTVAGIKAVIYTYSAANWSTDDDAPDFPLPSGCNYLGQLIPVQLISFSGSNNGNLINLKWQTTREENFLYYDLEKSIDGLSFAPLSRLISQGGQITDVKNYYYTDLKPQKGFNFYRLKMVSANGEEKYSNIVKILFGKANDEFVITPTTVNNSMRVSLGGNEFTHLSISDFAGRIVHQERLLSNVQTIDVARLPSGQYTVIVSGANKKAVQKIIIVK